MRSMKTKPQELLNQGMHAMRKALGRKEGMPNEYPYTRPRVHKEHNLIFQMFQRVSLFNETFKDPTLNHIDSVATVMFFFSAIMLVTCLPFSLLRARWTQCMTRWFGHVGGVFLWLMDCALRTIVAFYSMIYVWVPLNRFIYNAFKEDVKDVKDHLKEYMSNPDNYKPEVTNERAGMTLISFILAGLSLFGSLMLLMKNMQKILADDPEVLARELDEERRKYARIAAKGSGDMSANKEARKDADEAVPAGNEADQASGDAATVRKRKTPIRSCRLRSSFGRDASQDAQ